MWSIVRTSLVYGWPITGRQNLATVIIDRLKNGESYEGDTGTYRTPIYVEHLTEGIMQLVANYHPGTFHFAGTDWMNMYQFGRAVAEVFDLDSRPGESGSKSRPVYLTEKAPTGRVRAGPQARHIRAGLYTDQS